LATGVLGRGQWFGLRKWLLDWNEGLVGMVSGRCCHWIWCGEKIRGG